MMTEHPQADTDQHMLRLEQEAAEYISANDRLRAVTMFDSELGIGSPDAMAVELEYIHQIAVRYKRPYSVALIDLDEYDAYLGYYGRKAGRLAHKLMAEHIRHSCRSADRLYRFNEATPVLLILPETGVEGAQVLAERVVRSFAQRKIPNSRSECGLLTLNAGITACESGEGQVKSAWSELLEDVQLYSHVARGKGGNCVASQDDDSSDPE